MFRRTVELALTVVLATPLAWSQTFTLVEDAAPRAAVVLGDDPTDLEVLARDELVAYVQRATGATLPTDPAAGLPGRVDLVVSPAEAFRIGRDVTPQRLRITGSSPVALLIGVYRFLADCLDCRWIVPGEIGEIVPHADTVVVPVGSEATTPDWDVRTFFLRNEDGYWWALRNGLNGWFSAEFVQSLGTGVGDDLLYVQPGIGGFHAWAHILNPDEYRAEHPEYYALVGGRRVLGGLHSGQICTTNPEAIAIIAARARAYFEADPHARFYSVAPNDGYGWCECARCMAFEESIGGPRHWRTPEGQVITSDRQVQFANEVAARALPGLHGRELIIFAYVNHAPPPAAVEPQPGVTVWLCHYAPACYAHAFSDPDCPENAEFFGYVKGWARWADRMGYYAYTDKSMWEGLPRPVVRQMMADIRTLHDLGWRRYVAQSSAGWFGLNGPLYWMTARLLWDVHADVEALLADYFQRAYGPAAEEMAAFYHALEAAAADPREHYDARPFEQGPRVFSRAEMEAARPHLVAALEATADDAARERVQARLDQFDAGVLRLTYGWAQAEFAATGDHRVLADAVQAAQVLAAAGGRTGERFRDILARLEMLAERGLSFSGVSPPLELGGREAWASDETGPGDGAAGWMMIEVPGASHDRTYILELTVWGTSSSFGPVICTGGGGVGTASGGVWTPLPLIEGALSGEEQWDVLRYRVKPEMFDPEIVGARLGFGGGDSQIWIADAEFIPQDD